MLMHKEVKFFPEEAPKRDFYADFYYFFYLENKSAN